MRSATRATTESTSFRSTPSGRIEWGICPGDARRLAPAPVCRPRVFPLHLRTVKPPTDSHARFRRAIERRALWIADAARELPNLPLEDALQLVHSYAERGSPKFERAALRWLQRGVLSLAGHLRIEEREPRGGRAEQDGRSTPSDSRRG